MHVALCGEYTGTELQASSAVQLTLIIVPRGEGVGAEYMYGPEIVEPLQSTKCKIKNRYKHCFVRIEIEIIICKTGNILMQLDTPEKTHCPEFDTLEQVKFCGLLYGTVLHIYPAEQLTDMTLPIVAGVGTVYVYGPENVAALQSTIIEFMQEKRDNEYLHLIKKK